MSVSVLFIFHKLESIYGKGEMIMRSKKKEEIMKREKEAEESIYRLLEDPDFRELVASYDALLEEAGLTAEDVLEHAIENATENRKDKRIIFVGHKLFSFKKRGE